jgi:23S rRNA (cytidine1920-2'-O)/16S rRNA (cytidine1409-2'-O)-methyltransferase
MTARRGRLDVLLVERGLVESRSLAQALIMAGRVRVDGRTAEKAGMQVAADAAVELAEPPRFVSRGGEKLEHGLRTFGIDVTGVRALDVGASTGGFTDCLLQHGAAAVVALDVGRAQLHERLRGDGRVTVIEGVNARALECGRLPFAPEFLTVDVSFISLAAVLPAVLACMGPGWRAVLLVKPQFEAGRADVRRGVVRDPAVRARTVQDRCEWLADRGIAVLGVCDSSLPGPAGNREFLVYAAAPDSPAAREHPIDVAAAIRDAVVQPAP